MDWCAVSNLPQASAAASSIRDLILFCFAQNIGYETIYTALNKMVDISLYEAQIEVCL